MPFSYIVLSFTYFIFVVQVMGAIISGIILDAFGARREARLSMIEDKKNVDFVSGLHRSAFEEINLDFDFIRDEYHDWRNYLYYCVYLDEKDEDDYTGVESYMAGLLAAQPHPDPEFFPTGRCALMDAARAKKKDDSKRVNEDEDVDAGTEAAGREQEGDTQRQVSAAMSKDLKESAWAQLERLHGEILFTYRNTSDLK